MAATPDNHAGALAYAALVSPSTAFLITPTDNAALSQVTSVVNCSAACTLNVMMADGSQVALYFPAGNTWIRVAQVWATGSTLNAAVINGLA